MPLAIVDGERLKIDAVPLKSTDRIIIKIRAGCGPFQEIGPKRSWGRRERFDAVDRSPQSPRAQRDAVGAARVFR